MAFSNIFREPRRELTESAVGIVAVAAGLSVWIAADYHFSLWLEKTCGPIAPNYPNDPVFPLVCGNGSWTATYVADLDARPRRARIR